MSNSIQGIDPENIFNIHELAEWLRFKGTQATREARKWCAKYGIRVYTSRGLVYGQDILEALKREGDDEL